MIAARSVAQDSTMWYDVRNNTTSAGTGIGGQLIAPGAPAQPYTNGQEPASGSGNSANNFGTAAINGGARGAGEILRLNPVQASGFNASPNPNGGSAWPNYDADTNSSTGSLYLYMDVNDDPSGVGDVISSIGINHIITNGPLNTVPRNTIASVAFTMANDATVAAANGAAPPVPWNGVVNGASDGGTPPSVIGTKAVRVPVTTGPVYAATLGIQPNAVGPYRLGRLDVTAGARSCLGRTPNAHVNNSTYQVKLTVNNLLITRVFSSGGDAVENVAFGYDPLVADGGFGTLDAAVSGSVSGNTSTSPDAIIQVRLHGDFSGDGNVTGADVAGFNAAVTASLGGACKVSQMYLGDFNNNRTVTGADIAGFVNATSASLTCP